jgi:hypothetical protein
MSQVWHFDGFTMALVLAPQQHLIGTAQCVSRFKMSLLITGVSSPYQIWLWDVSSDSGKGWWWGTAVHEEVHALVRCMCLSTFGLAVSPFLWQQVSHVGAVPRVYYFYLWFDCAVASFVGNVSMTEYMIMSSGSQCGSGRRLAVDHQTKVFTGHKTMAYMTKWSYNIW